MPKRRNSNLEQKSKKQKLSNSDDCKNITYNEHFFDKENISWPYIDIVQLLANIENEIPKDDNLSYTSRMDKLKWENIAFKNYSSQECQDIWALLHKQVRTFRLLNEIVTDVKDLTKKLKLPAGTRYPDKPKHPKNSYMIFVEEKRQEIVDANPTLNSMDIFRKLGEEYNNLPVEVKERYTQRAEIERQNYTEKLQSFYEKHPEIIPKKLVTRRKSTQCEDDAPKKPKTPFELFKFQSEKEKNESSTFFITQKSRGRWRELKDKEKLFWINWAEEEHTKYLNDLKEYIETHPEFKPGKFKPILNKKEKEIQARFLGKPQKPPLSSYHLYSKIMLKNHDIPYTKQQDKIKFVSEQWRACSEEEKNEYKIRVEQMWEEYDMKLEAYILTLPPEQRDSVRKSQGRKKRKDSVVEKPKKPSTRVKVDKPQLPPIHIYDYFLSVYQGQENPEIVWDSMAREEKRLYAAKLIEEKHKYVAKYEAYLKTLSREELENFQKSSNQ